MYLFAHELMKRRQALSPVEGGPSYIIEDVGSCYKWISANGLRYEINSFVRI